MHADPEDTTCKTHDVNNIVISWIWLEDVIFGTSAPSGNVIALEEGSQRTISCGVSV